MKQTLRLIAILLLVFMAVPMMAQTETPEKETKNAKIVVENGRKKLVLDTGRTTSNSTIELYSDTALWRILDSLVTAPWGGNSVRVKDIKGYNVDIQKARINDEIGVFFLSRGMMVAVTEKELAKLE